MTKKTDLVVQPIPMKVGNKAIHVLTMESVVIRQVNHGLVQSYWVHGPGRNSDMFRATHMELIPVPKGK